MKIISILNEKSLYYAKKGLEHNNLISQCTTGHLYIRKGYAKWRLGDEDFLESFKIALEYFRQNKQKDM